jgi:flagellar biosynthesis protein FlhF
MKIKRYTARDMRQAMQKVREDQGPDAVILSSRRSDGMVEIVAAIDYDEALVRGAFEPFRSDAVAVVAPDARVASARPNIAKPPLPAVAPTPRAKSAPVVAAKAPAAAAQAAPIQRTAPSVASEAMSAPSTSLPIAADNAQMQAAPIAAENTQAPTTPPAPKLTPDTAPASAARAALEAGAERVRMHDEIGQLRHLLETQLSSLAWNDLDRRQPLRASVLRDLTRFGIETDVAAMIVDDLPATLSPQQSRYLPLGLISRRLRISTDADELGGVIALVGTTGAGKTTSLAKLAARHVQRRGRHSVALIGTDDYRVGAHDQLLHYGRALGVQTFSAADASELGRLLVHLSDRELILIDTPGLGLRDARLPSVIDMLKANANALRCTLVLPANVQAGSLEHSVCAYAPLEPAGCILTKLDEATSLGGALSVAIRHRLPLEYVTHGQRVPEDIALADARRLVCRLADTPDSAMPPEVVMAERFGRVALAHT